MGPKPLVQLDFADEGPQLKQLLTVVAGPAHLHTHEGVTEFPGAYILLHEV